MAKHSDKLVVGFFLVALISLSFYFGGSRITGFSTVSVTVQNKTQGEISLDYDYNVNLTFHQNIRAQFQNTGSNSYNARIEVYIYQYNNETRNLALLASYYDNYVVLKPGETTSYETTYLPYETGLYYIKVRVPYGNRLVEQWGAFYSVFTWEQEQPVIFIPTSYGGGTLTGNREYGVTGMSISFDDYYNVYPGEEALVRVSVNNTGTISLTKLRVYSTQTEYFSYEAKPSEIRQLLYGQSGVFLLTIKTSEKTPPGEYDFYFEVLGVETKRGGNVKLNISSVFVSIEDDVREELFRYEYLVTEMEQRIYEAQKNGYNTSTAQDYQNNAKWNLNLSNSYFEAGEFEDARQILQIVKKDMENVVIELAELALVPYEDGGIDPLVIILIIGAGVCAIVAYEYYQKKKENRRPKLIREFMEGET